MSKNTHLLAFSCPCCNKGSVSFSVFDIEQNLTCSLCASTFTFDTAMRNAIRQFVALCSRIYDANAILGDAAVSVSMHGDKSVEIPFQLLFSRFPVVLNLVLDGKKIAIRFIFDALQNHVLHKESSFLS